MNNRIYKVVGLVWLMYSTLTACTENKKTSNESGYDENNAVATADSMVSKFLPYYSNLALDTNAFIFYCARTFDTSSLIHIQKDKSEIKALYYEMLPTYHQNINDFANKREEQLMFFEGYSFIMDSTTWQEIKVQANMILQAPDTFRRDIYKDGSRYGLYYGSQQRRGDSNHETFFENFAAFLKKSFLQEIIQARKPEVHLVSPATGK